MHDDVVARLADGSLEIVKQLWVELEELRHAAEHAPNESKRLRARVEPEADRRGVFAHARLVNLWRLMRRSAIGAEHPLRLDAGVAVTASLQKSCRFSAGTYPGFFRAKPEPADRAQSAGSLPEVGVLAGGFTLGGISERDADRGTPAALTADCPQQLTAAGRHCRDQLARLGQSVAQLAIADFDR